MLRVRLYSLMRPLVAPNTAGLAALHILAAIGVGVHPRYRSPTVDDNQLDVELDLVAEVILGRGGSRVLMPGAERRGRDLGRLLL